MSAALDHEDPGIDLVVVESHLATCGACRDYAREAQRLRRTLRVRPVSELPDLTDRIMAAIYEERPASPPGDRGLRLALAVVAMFQLAVSVPVLVLGREVETSVHLARHVGSMSVALAVGLLFVAWRPSRAPGLLPFVVALVACVIGTTVVDVIAARATFADEVVHVPELAGLVLCWMLAHPRAAPSVAVGTT